MPNPNPKPNPIRNPTTNPIPNPTNPIPYSSGNLLLRRKLHYARPLHFNAWPLLKFKNT